MLDSALVADESEAFVDQKSSDRPAWHTVSSGATDPPGIIPEVGKLSAGDGPAEDAAQTLPGSADDLPIHPPSSGAVRYFGAR
jgi:hypothetical protein